MGRFAEAWGAAAALGYGLDPGPGDTARAAVERHDELQRQAKAQAPDTRAERRRIAARLAAGTLDLADAAQAAHDAETAQAVHATGKTLLEEAAVIAVGRAAKALGDIGEDLVTAHLHPCLAAVLDAAAALAPKVGGITDDVQAVRAPKAAREAWARLVELLGHYDAILAAAGAAHPYTGTRLDETRHHAEFLRHRRPLNLDAGTMRRLAAMQRPEHRPRALLDMIAADTGPGLYSVAQAEQWSREHDTAQAAA